METRASYAAVGAFVLSLLVGIFIFILWMSKVERRQGVLYDIYIEGSVSGLRESEAITYNGVPIGAIYKIEILPKRLERVRVTVAIQNRELIREGAYATLEPKGITGLSELQIHGSNSLSPPLKARRGKRYPIIEFRRSQFQQVVESAPRILEGLASLVQDMRPLFEEENRQHFSHILTNLDRFAETLGKKAESVEAVLAKIDKCVDSFDHAMKDISQLVQVNQAPIRAFTTAGLYEFSQLMIQMKTLAGSLNRVSGKLEDAPHRFLFGDPEAGKEID